MQNSIYDPIADDVDEARRSEVQEDFGRHLVENRNRMAELVRKWIETDAAFPIPIYDRLLDQVRQLDPSMREAVASISLLMADQIVSGVLATFDKGDEMRALGSVVNYAIVAQIRRPSQQAPIENVDVNSGKPVIAMWDRYKKWLSRFAPSKLRATLNRTTIKESESP